MVGIVAGGGLATQPPAHPASPPSPQPHTAASPPSPFAGGWALGGGFGWGLAPLGACWGLHWGLLGVACPPSGAVGVGRRAVGRRLGAK